MSGDASSPGDAAAEPPPARVPQEPVRTKPARPVASDGAPPPAEAGDSPRALPAEAPASTEAGADAPEDPRGHLDALGAVALDRDPLESDASAALTSMAAAAGPHQPSAWSRNRDNTCPVDGCAGVRVAPAGSNRLPLTCASHAGVLSLLVGGVPSRGCQACRAFHPVEHFARGNKTCEDRLKWKKMRYHEKTAFASGISGSAPRKRGRPPKSVRSADEIRSDAEAAEAAAAAAAAALAAASASAPAETEQQFSAVDGEELRGNAHALEDANASEARRRALMRAIVDANSNANANEAGIRATGGAGAGAFGWNALAGFGSGFGAGMAGAEDARVAALIASTSPTEPADVRDVSAAAIAKHLGLGDLTNDAGGDTGMQEAAARSAERARTLLRRAHDLELRASATLELAQRRAAGGANIAGLHGSANGVGGQVYGDAQDGCRVM